MFGMGVIEKNVTYVMRSAHFLSVSLADFKIFKPGYVRMFPNYSEVFWIVLYLLNIYRE